MQQFFESWSESIRHNAEQDQKATKRRLLAQMLNKAVNTGAIGKAEAQSFADRAGIGTLSAGVNAAEAARVASRGERPEPLRVQSAMQNPDEGALGTAVSLRGRVV